MRLNYIDSTKGLLILFVIVGHFLSSMHRQLEGNIFLNSGLEIKDLCWLSYYMPAFFLITGYCSNFSKYSFKDFFWKNFKSIKIPAIFFGFPKILIHFLNHGGVSFPIIMDTLSTLLFNSGLWFLDALFIAKIFYWVLNNYLENKYARGIVLLLFYVISALINNLLSLQDSLWILHGIMLALFLWVGQYLKPYVFNYRWLISSLFIYIGSIIFLNIYQLPVPSITHNLYIPNNSIILSLVLSISGSIGIISVMQKIPSLSVFESIGKNSIVYYCVHFVMLSLLTKVGIGLMYDTVLISFVVFSVMIVITVIFCHLMAILLSKKPFNILLGKF